MGGFEDDLVVLSVFFEIWFGWGGGVGFFREAILYKAGARSRGTGPGGYVNE